MSILSHIHPIGPQFSQIYKDKDMEFLGKTGEQLIVGLTGPTKSGKSLIAKILVTEYDFQYASMSFPVKEIMRSLGKMNADWIEIGKLADSLRKDYQLDYLAQKVYEYTQRSLPNKPRIVVDGILHPAERDFFSSKYDNFHFIGVTAIQKLRIQYAEDTKLVGAKKLIKERDKREQVYSSRGNLFAPDIKECMSKSRKFEIHDFDRDKLSRQVNEMIQKILAIPR